MGLDLKIGEELWGLACNIAIRAKLGVRSCNHIFHKTRQDVLYKKVGFVE